MDYSTSFSPNARKHILEGKVAVITGGASGIGACTARLFCQHGAKVVIADVQDELGSSLCTQLGPAATFVHCDVTDEDHVILAVDLAVREYGKLDVMFNNAGVCNALSPGIQADERADLDRVLAVNVVGPFLGTKHAARAMAPARRGSIITTASIAGCAGGTVASHAYTVSKHAVVGLTRSTAADLGRFGIRVNCISPAYIVTPLVMNVVVTDDAGEVEEMTSGAAALKVGRLKVDDVARAALYLASDESQFVSGHNLVVDGGLTVVSGSLNAFPAN